MSAALRQRCPSPRHRRANLRYTLDCEEPAWF